MKNLTLLLAGFLLAGTCTAQLRPTEKDSAINDVLKTLEDNYVFPDVVKAAMAYVRKQQQAGAYISISSGEQLANKLTADIRVIAKDLHINVGYSPTVIPEFRVSVVPPPEIEKEIAEMHRRNNYGIKGKNILPGNIGYINIGMFGLLEYCADSLVTAMQYLSGTDALIIDLRENTGSMDPSAIPFFSGYFFQRPVHLNDFYNRYTNDTTQSWSYGWVPGKRYYDKPVYILTSGSTFSGGEEFAYDFKNLKRATIIGETTRGGANPGGDIRANDHFTVFVPTGRAINPITKTNWEGVGVKPDTMIKSNRALYKAHVMALEQLAAATTSEKQKTARLQQLHAVKAKPPVFKSVTFTLDGYDQAKEVMLAGSFNGWSPTANKLQRKGKQWIATIEAEPGEHQYKFIVDGNWITDPANKQVSGEGQFANSVIRIE